MNKNQARKVAHGAVAALVRVNAEFQDSDLWETVGDELSEDDIDRVISAFDEIGDYHARKAH